MNINTVVSVVSRNHKRTFPFIPSRLHHQSSSRHSYGTMDITRIALIFALFVVVSAHNRGSKRHFGGLCYKKSQKCCFKFEPCGSVNRRVRSTVPCPFKKCSTTCKPKCTIVHTKKAKHGCYQKKVGVGRTCKYHGYDYVCKPKFAYKKFCYSRPVFHKRKVCKKACHRTCKNINATCIKFKIWSFPKFCPKLTCSKFYFRGNTKAPKERVGKKGKVIKVIKVIDAKRIIKN